MPYHTRFGHADDPAWITSQIKALGELLGIAGKRHEKQRIWPIVQLADWGQAVPVDQITDVIGYGTQQPSTGVMTFHWSGISQQWSKAEALKTAYRSIRWKDD